MTALLTENLPLVAGAPNGFKKLRELILELAVRGELVPQSPDDESADRLLGQIRAERARAMAAGQIKKEKPAAAVSADEQPFPLPSGWCWCRVVDTGDYINGLAFSSRDWSASGRPIIRIQNLSGRNQQFNRTEADVDESVVVSEGDILVSWSATLDAYIWRGEQGVLNQHIFRVAPSGLVTRPYLFWLMKWVIRVLADSDHSHGLVMAHINRGPFLAQPVGLPPLSEQHRIVAKIDELMVLCDTLEAQQASAESAHARLVQALLDSLTQATDAESFAANWRRLSEHFDTLFTTEASIDALKQAVLQLAVMGKLVPQDPTDEPASELLRRIDADKARLAEAGAMKQQKPLSTVSIDEHQFNLPSGWEWSRLGNQVVESGAGWSPSCEARPRSGAEWGVLKVSAVSWGIYQPGENKALPPDMVARPENEVAVGDFLVSRANTAELVARSVVVEETPRSLMLSDKIVRLKLTSLSNGRYLNLVNSAPLARQYYARVAGGTSGSMKNVSRDQILNLLVALPPLAEQHRIVARVDEIMGLCDQLKSRLVQVRNLSQQLASTLVERAVA